MRLNLKKLKVSALVLSVLLIFSISFSGCSYNFDNKPLEEDKPAAPNGSITGVAPQLEKAPFYDSVEGFPDIMAPKGFDWYQFNGITLNFISENNVYATVLSKEADQFTKITGIKIKIHALDFDTMTEKINLDFISKTGKYQVVYVDPYQTLTRFASKLVDLNTFNSDPGLPHIPGGVEDFFQSQLDVDSYFLGRDKLYAIPFDSPTMILCYRKDILERYNYRFKDEKGYYIEPGSKDFTWERYYEAVDWINKNVPKSEVKYGAGHQAKQHNSLFCDFSNILAAYGGNYFTDADIGSIGAKKPSAPAITSPEGIKALEIYKKIIAISDPRSLSWDWLGAAEAFKSGDLVFMPNFNEYASMFENPLKSRVQGKVGYSLLPYGPSRSANIFGGSGIGVNSDAPLREQQAAWLFILWVTSPHTELFVFKHPEGGDVPLRKSVYEVPEIKQAMVEGSEGSKKFPTLLPMQSVLEAWKTENTYQRPKVEGWPQLEKVITEELYKMITKDVKAEDTAGSIKKRIEEITKE